jgi:glycosyltransferase involved in cell wall biosynthesis
MNKLNLVSILLPTYNRANLLPQCIDSILAQSYSNWELIISDDASTDDTSIVSQQYVEFDPRIQYNKNPSRVGLPANRNVAISISQGELIFFVEDDLTVDRDCLKILVNTYKEFADINENVGAIAPRLIQINKERFNKGPLSLKNNKIIKSGEVIVFDKKTGSRYGDFGIDTKQIKEVPDVHACSLYLKYALRKVGGYEENAYKGNYTCEEVDLNFRIRKIGFKLYFQPKAVVHHYKSEVGGVRLSSAYLTNYYMIRNHIIFIFRNFGIKSFYMIPLYLFHLINLLIKYFTTKILFKT